MLSCKATVLLLLFALIAQVNAGPGPSNSVSGGLKDGGKLSSGSPYSLINVNPTSNSSASSLNATFPGNGTFNNALRPHLNGTQNVFFNGTLPPPMHSSANHTDIILDHPKGQNSFNITLLLHPFGNFPPNASMPPTPTRGSNGSNGSNGSSIKGPSGSRKLLM